MINDDSKKSKILAGTDLTLVRDSSDFNMVRGITRRDFVKYSVGTVAGLYLGTLYTGCAGNSGGSQIASYPIDPSGVVTTAQRMITFPMPGMNGAPANPTAPGSGTGLYKTELCQISQYAQFGYGVYTLNGEPLPIVQRTDLMPSGYTNPSPVRLQKFARFFTISDLHITDKESPNQSDLSSAGGCPIRSAFNSSLFACNDVYNPYPRCCYPDNKCPSQSNSI